MLLRTNSCNYRKKFYLRKFCLIMISLVLISVQINAQNGWTKKRNLPTPRAWASAPVFNDKIYVIGGFHPAIGDFAVNEVYDPLTDTWETKQPMPTKRAGLLTAVINDTIYAMGGSNTSFLDKNEAYDPITNLWTTKAKLPYTWNGVYGDTSDGIIYIMGGHYYRQNCFSYDPSTNSWTEKTPIPPGGCKGTLSATTFNGLIYTFGGVTNYPDGPMSTVNVYNPKTDTWESKASMPTPRYALRTFLVQDKIYALGGSQSNGNALSTVEVYDPTNNTWETLPNMPFKITWFTGAVFSNKIYVFGGTPDWLTGGQEVWEYDPAYVIPVELTSFIAAAKGKEVKLSWSTATELNNQGFEVQRKFGSNDFVTIGSIKGHGTTTSQNQYSYVDKLVDAGKYFYRLKQIDYGGTFEYSNEIEVEVRVLDKFSLEQNNPNPWNPTTTIGYVLQEKSNAKLTILNSIGEEIAVLVNEEEEKGYHKVEFNGSKLTSGVYFYKLQAGNFVETKKMILLR